MIEKVILSVFGLLFLVTGLNLWRKEKIEMLISDYQNISEKDKKDYTRKMGWALMLIGIGMISNPLVNLFFDQNYGWFVMVITFLIASILFVRTQKKYKGKM